MNDREASVGRLQKESSLISIQRGLKLRLEAEQDRIQSKRASLRERSSKKQDQMFEAPGDEGVPPPPPAYPPPMVSNTREVPPPETEVSSSQHISRVMSADSKITGMSHDGSEEDDINEIKASKPVSRARRFVPLAVGIAAVAAVGIGLYFFMDNNDIALANKSQSENFQGTVTAAELAEHNTEDDCWLLIHGTVYDLTEYAPKHPGGARVITDLAGTDASAEYDLEHPVSLLTTIPETIVGTYVGGSLSVSNEDDDGEGSDDNVGEETVMFTPTSPPEGQTSEGVDNGQSSFEGDAQVTAFISEFHYDNEGSDVDQMIEVAYSNQLDMSGFKVEFYRGSTGEVYDTESLQSFAIGRSVNGLTFASRKIDTIRNGPDGIALIDDMDRVIEFISYGGNVSAIEGYAVDMNSTDIGVEESSATPIGWSLQKTGSGCLGDDFYWGEGAPSTPGDLNEGMEVTCYEAGVPVPAPAPWAETSSPTETCYADHYDLNTIALHDTPGEDCWEAIFGIVYDFTVYADLHSGGPDRINPHCGTDASQPYLDRHSRSLLKYITEYIVGRVGDVSGVFPVTCERRLEHADSGFWDYDWESVEEFEEYARSGDAWD